MTDPKPGIQNPPHRRELTKQVLSRDPKKHISIGILEGYPYLIVLQHKGVYMGYPFPYFCLCASLGPELSRVRSNRKSSDVMENSPSSPLLEVPKAVRRTLHRNTAYVSPGTNSMNHTLLRP